MKIKGSDGQWIQDQLPDDQSLIIRSKNGLTVLLGCAHSGLINILNHVTKAFPGERIHTVCGGTHLGFAGEEQLQETLQALDLFEISRIGTSHCTGLENAAKLHNHFGDKFFFAAVGTSFEC
jgi:7,8-dihydropterin-6-yl-methyl-4-(beta-D-ribofuranosyl)aminobenzene 5'-phosphate synthase